MVSVTIGHGTSLMAPSNIRNTMTRPERMRPVQRASLEVGRVSAMTVMIDPRCLEWLFEFKTNEGSGGRQGGVRNFSTAPLPPSYLVGEGGIGGLWPLSRSCERFTRAMTGGCSTTRHTVTKPCTVIYVRYGTTNTGTLPFSSTSD